MDVVGSEIGQKMRSAIKAKLTELGCYVDDELPDYVMVMVANKRTQLQMEDDLQLFLGDNTELFVNWLHQVLKKLQEVTVAVPLKQDKAKSKERSVSKERKSKDKKDKEKSKKGDVSKKSKKKEKEKEHKKADKKIHKSKKEKKKSHERIRPNIPPLLMNMEKNSEPSITDVFAGQILKNHGVSLDSFKDDIIEEKKPIIKEKRPILPIIDPATILTEPEPEINTEGPRENQLKEINEIEAKIQGLKQKLVEQLDSMSEDEDFLNIRTEAEELMNDFAEDVFQEISQAPTIAPAVRQAQEVSRITKESPIQITDSPEIHKSPTHPKVPQTPEIPKIPDIPKETHKDPIETLPQIELNLPKRPIRERLGARELPKIPEKKAEKQRSLSPERLTKATIKRKRKQPIIPMFPNFTPEREIEVTTKSTRSRLGSQAQTEKKDSDLDNSPEGDSSSKKLTSKVQERRACASVVRVRPRPRAAPASNLLLRAVADAHKSLLNIPPKVDPEPSKIKRALVLPMRRCVDPKKIVIQVSADRQTNEDEENLDSSSHRLVSSRQKEEYTPLPITKRFTNTDYVPSRTASKKDDSLIIETINIHNPTVDKDKDTQFIVTMDGFNPNAFLAKKLMTEGLLDEDDEETEKLKESKPKQKVTSVKRKHSQNKTEIEKDKNVDSTMKESNKETPKVEESKKKDTVLEKYSDNSQQNIETAKEKETKKDSPISPEINQSKRLSDTSEDSDTQVIIKKENEKAEKRKSTDDKEVTPAKKRKASPIVFDVEKKEETREKRERTVSGSSDGHVTLSTVTNSHKYDSIPPLSQAAGGAGRKPLCRAFPACRWGGACVFAHPRCKFAAACTRRGCVYQHPPAHSLPALPSHVVPAANYKSISSVANLCKFYPNCANAACHFYHPKPCRFGPACANKTECNFYHPDVKKYAI